MQHYHVLVPCSFVPGEVFVVHNDMGDGWLWVTPQCCSVVVSCSFVPGEVFVVHNDMGDGWLWVTSQSTGLSGIINRELVQELVRTPCIVSPFVFPLLLLFLLIFLLPPSLLIFPPHRFLLIVASYIASPLLLSPCLFSIQCYLTFLASHREN